MEFFIKSEDIKKVIDDTSACVVSNEILLNGEKVGYMYRETPSTGFNDSGWRFFAGYEDEKYCDNAENFNIVELNTLCNYDLSVKSKLNVKVGAAYAKDDKNGK